jgi:hypothetical protein
MIGEDMIAPCGMNCALCIAHQRKKNVCPGCLGDDENKSRSCISCSILNCDKRKNTAGGAGYCFQCEEMPCRRLKQLDKRYRTKYHMSMMENLAYIRDKGIDEFLKEQRRKWTCPSCGGFLSVHRKECTGCGYEWIDQESLSSRQ